MHGGLAKEIGMSQTEAEKIKPLQDAHFAKLDAFQGEIVQLRQEALSEFGKVDADSGAAMAAFDKIGAVQVAMEKERYRHFYEILALCTPEEAQKFQEIMPRLLERRNQPENRPMRPPL